MLLPGLALSQKGLRVSAKARQELGVRIRQTLPVLSGIMRKGSGEGVHQNQLLAQSARANSVILIMLEKAIINPPDFWVYKDVVTLVLYDSLSLL
jgi:hypothetical protein